MAGKKINFISKYLNKRLDSEADILRRNALKVIVSIEYIKKEKYVCGEFHFMLRPSVIDFLLIFLTFTLLYQNFDFIHLF